MVIPGLLQTEDYARAVLRTRVKTEGTERVVSGAAELIGRSYPQANDAIQRLVSAGILAQVTIGRRNRAFEAPAIIDAFTDLERQLAASAADTRSPPGPGASRHDGGGS